MSHKEIPILDVVKIVFDIFVDEVTRGSAG